MSYRERKKNILNKFNEETITTVKRYTVISLLSKYVHTVFSIHSDGNDYLHAIYANMQKRATTRTKTLHVSNNKKKTDTMMVMT